VSVRLLPLQTQTAEQAYLNETAAAKCGRINRAGANVLLLSIHPGSPSGHALLKDQDEHGSGAEVAARSSQIGDLRYS